MAGFFVFKKITAFCEKIVSNLAVARVGYLKNGSKFIKLILTPVERGQLVEYMTG